MCNCVIITSTMKKPHSSPKGVKKKKNTSLSLTSGCSQAHLQGGQGQNKGLQGQTHSEPSPVPSRLGCANRVPVRTQRPSSFTFTCGEVYRAPQVWSSSPRREQRAATQDLHR